MAVPLFLVPPSRYLPPVSLYRCTDALWRWHDSSPSTSAFSPCWSGYGPALESPQPAVGVSSLADGAGGDETVGEAVDGVVTDETADSDHPAEAFLSEEVKNVASLEGDGSDTCSENCPASLVDPVLEESATSTSEAAGEGVVPGPGWGGVVGMDAESLLGNTVLVSVSAGPKDLMVHPSLCVADGLGLDGQGLVLTTSEVEGCGFGMDHLALAWCKQLVSR